MCVGGLKLSEDKGPTEMKSCQFRVESIEKASVMREEVDLDLN